jgi:hypothetical protein
MSLAVKYLSLVAVGILLTNAPCHADAPGTLFRHAFSCPERGPSSVCIFGTIPKGKPVTLIAGDWKSTGVPKQEFPNTDFDNGFKTITRLAVAVPPPKDAFMIAVLAAAETVSLLPLKEVQDQAVAGRIGQYLEGAKDLKTASDLHEPTKTRLLRLSPTILLSETFLTPPDGGGELSIGCVYCEVIPMLVGQDLTDLLATVRYPNTCGGIKFAFALSGRPHLVSFAETCESDSFSATLIHDLSGKQPKRVF